MVGDLYANTLRQFLNAGSILISLFQTRKILVASMFFMAAHQFSILFKLGE